MKLTRRTALAGTFVAVASSGAVRRARAETPVIKVGVLTDLSGPYRDINGPNGIACAKQAAAEFMAANPGIRVEVIGADHQNKPDVGTSILRGWYDNDGVDMVTDLTNSAVALACSAISAEKDRVCMVTAGGSSALTGASCNANTVHWTYDSWNLAHVTGTAVTKQGGASWFFVTPNYAYGKAIQADATKAVELAGGKVLGSATYPFPETTDFSAMLLQAQSTGAKVVAFGVGGTDFVNLMKQSHEFGLNKTAQLVGMTGFITDILGMGPAIAQGTRLTENFYWDMNDRTRDWTRRVRPLLTQGAVPNSMQAGNYAATLHFLKAVKELGPEKAKGAGRLTVATMKRMPTEDDCFGKGSIRIDGRKIHPSYLFQVKQADAIRQPGAVYDLVATTGPEDAFRPLSEGGCKLVKA
ncbi:ABC transporter substrate-binding protein [Rhodopila sp.]|jgi:branched-chain amino acid transport system substrate-binding protein|uniref:ABC transporter substrate-binding protein n=1 Tax=Rhodopila sp. TaxID=2480087 RepID=UPI002B962979|nr:ABC transporter substrate-binding protein [Rhodopila sp.]HVZ07868.1 ABC transporter substrate-binding protein [Rhodopila sp.]